MRAHRLARTCSGAPARSSCHFAPSTVLYTSWVLPFCCCMDTLSTVCQKGSPFVFSGSYLKCIGGKPSPYYTRVGRLARPSIVYSGRPVYGHHRVVLAFASNVSRPCKDTPYLSCPSQPRLPRPRAG